MVRTIIPTLALVLLGGAAIAEEGGAGGGNRRDAWLKEHEPELFKQADANGDGVLDEQERATLRKLMAEKMFTRFDTDKDGFVSKSEFEAGVEAMAKEMRAGREAKGDDAKGEGKDDGDDAGGKGGNAEMRQKAIDRRFDKADANHDGKLDKEEFANAMPGQGGGRRGGKGGEAGGDKGDDAK